MRHVDPLKVFAGALGRCVEPGARAHDGRVGEYHLMLIDLKRPLKDGERFDLTLRFERAGERTVTVWVQVPRGEAAGGHRH